MYTCNKCKANFAYPSELKRHSERKISCVSKQCHLCNNVFVSKQTLQKHITNVCSKKQKSSNNSELLSSSEFPKVINNPDEPIKLDVSFNRDNANRDNVRSRSRSCKRSSSRANSRAKEIRDYPNIIGCIYVYQLIPKFSTRKEALEELIRLSIIVDHDDRSVIICKDDLKGKILLKVGQTAFAPSDRQLNYCYDLFDIYEFSETTLMMYNIDFVTRLPLVEEMVKNKLITSERIGLIGYKGTIYYPYEVFISDNIHDVKEKIEIMIEELRDINRIDKISKVEFNNDLEMFEIDELQSDTLGNKVNKVDFSNNLEKLKMEQEITKRAEFQLKQIQEQEETKRSEFQLKQTEFQYKLKVLELCKNHNLSEDLLNKILLL